MKLLRVTLNTIKGIILKFMLRQAQHDLIIQEQCHDN